MLSTRGPFAKVRDADLAKSPWSNLILGASVLCVLGYYFHDSLLACEPSGIHYIRQTDSIAFARYYQLGRGHLLEPGILNLNLAPHDGRAAAEFPLLYWLASLLGSHCGDTSALRYINALLVAVGQASFAIVAKSLLRSTLLTIALSTWMLGSSVLAYYTLNYLPDAGVYGLVLMGWGCILPRAWNDPPRRSLIGAACLTLAALIKAPAAMHLVISASLFLTMERQHGRSRSLAPLCAGLLLAAAWHFWVNAYNAHNRTSYFLTRAMPIWQMGLNEVITTLDLVLRYWWSKYLHPSTWHGLALLLILLALRFRMIPRALRGFALGEALGAIAFLVLFFPKMADHDYYFITVLPAVSSIMLVGLGMTRHLSHPGFIQPITLIAAFSLAVSSAILARHELQRRHAAPPDKYSNTGAAMHQYRCHPGVPELPIDARVIVLGDATPHGALSALGRQGWSYPGYPDQTSPNWQTLKAQGATHILRLHAWPMADVPCELITSGPSFALYRIIQP